MESSCLDPFKNNTPVEEVFDLQHF